MPATKEEDGRTTSVDAEHVLAKPNGSSSGLKRSETLKDRLASSLTHAASFKHTVDAWFWSRAKVIEDDTGRKQQVTDSDPDKVQAMMKAMEYATQSSTTWIYLLSTLMDYKEAKTAAKRVALLQELANVCQYEYRSKQLWLERHVSVSPLGQAWYRRVGTRANGDGHVKLNKGVTLPKDDSQSSRLLRLCQFNVKVEQAAELLHNLEGVKTTPPTDAPQGYECDDSIRSALEDLSAIVGFTLDLRSALPMPSPQVKKAEGFIEYMRAVESTLDSIMGEFDFAAFGINISNMCEPTQFRQTINAVYNFYETKLRHDLVLWHIGVLTHCSMVQNLEASGERNDQVSHEEVNGRTASSTLDELSANLQKENHGTSSTRLTKKKAAKTGLVPFEPAPIKLKSPGISTETPLQENVRFSFGAAEQEPVPVTHQGCDEKKHKQKTRPQPTLFPFGDFTPSSDEPKAPMEPFRLRKVDVTTAAVFRQLFNKSQARGPLAWTSFCKAMTSKGVRFTLVPVGGSKVRFIPPEEEPVQKPILFHKFHGPHGEDIPPHAQLIWAKRLQRTYKWGIDTFSAE
ncbi:hypothetical protein GGR57DRAFT_519783 [Xylariaceae sp. FL1272]|nr:hypothetical protein GGR57DRAFT_519783 [Xylariaceae sp. FL1272]